ncbi:unnamed protein product [Phytomonas sp. EM1]|nr:unnamed protein product [Phytomonas sp. EM1]|eukprot:CCW61845.1 unnamed protein product [Phytomonas sp. isolate EM1]
MQPRQYQENPKRFDQDSARGEVAGLFHWIELLFKVIPVNLGALSNEGQMNSTLKPKVQYVPKQQLSDSYSNFPISRDFSSMDRRYVLNDAAYYKARNPTLHFCHSLIPSFGATIREKGYQVRDGVCLSSECVLLCVDIMHATILREGRTPVILMNPLVQVAYEKSHFDRLTRTRLYTSPTLFYFSTWLSDARQVWQRIKRWLFHPLKHSLPSGDVVMEKFKLARSERTPLAFEQTPEKPNNTIHAEGNPISVISAIDDVLDDTPTCDFYKGPLPVVIGHSGWNGSDKRWAEIDFVRYTSMMCNGYSSNELEILSTWLYWIGITLAIVLQLVFLSRDVNTRIQVKFVRFLSKFDCNGEESRNPSAEEMPPLDWRDAFLLLDSDHALATHSPNLSPRNSPLKLSKGSRSAFIAPIDSLELQKKYQPRGTRLVIPYTINNLSLNTFEIFACKALTTEKRLWMRVYGALVTRSLGSTFRPRAALRRWCRRLREVDQAYGVHFLCYRISNLYRVNRMIQILQRGMRKLVSKSRLFFRNRRNLRKFTDLL